MNHERMALCVAGIGLMVLGWALSSSLLIVPRSRLTVRRNESLAYCETAPMPRGGFFHGINEAEREGAEARGFL